MNIDIRLDGGFALQSDGNQWITAREKTIEDEDSDRYGETYLADKKYYASLETALKKLAERRLANSDAESLRELIAVHRRHLREIEEAVNHAEAAVPE